MLAPASRQAIANARVAAPPPAIPFPAGPSPANHSIKLPRRTPPAGSRASSLRKPLDTTVRPFSRASNLPPLTTPPPTAAITSSGPMPANPSVTIAVPPSCELRATSKNEHLYSMRTGGRRQPPRARARFVRFRPANHSPERIRVMWSVVSISEGGSAKGVGERSRSLGRILARRRDFCRPRAGEPRTSNAL